MRGSSGQKNADLPKVSIKLFLINHVGTEALTIGRMIHSGRYALYFRTTIYSKQKINIHLFYMYMFLFFELEHMYLYWNVQKKISSV
jgi:hypothetical protein